MYRTIFTLILCFFLISTNAQLPDGSTAPDFTTTDIDGNSHNLYSLLDQGYTVYLDFMATWCPPCWSYHNSNAMKNLYNQYGPSGTNEVRCFMIEADPSTPVSALYGGSGSMGNWANGTPYPIADDAGLGNLYAINYYPTIYAICPDRTIYEVGQMSTSGLYNHHQNMCALSYNVLSVNPENCFQSADGSIELVAENTTGNETYLWSNGATSRIASDLASGIYTCTISDGGRQIVTDQIEITGPDIPLSFNAGTIINHALCAGGENGSIQVTAEGGTPPYYYQWDDGSVGKARFQLQAGYYTVSVIDFNGCINSESFTIEEPDPIQLNDIQIIPEACDLENGSVIIEAYGGTGVLNLFLESKGTTSNEFTELTSGEYLLEVIDGNDCRLAEEISIPFLEGPEVSVSPPELITCTRQEVHLEGQSSIPGDHIYYEWTTDTGQLTGDFNKPSTIASKPGTYRLEVTDTETGCTADAEVIVVSDTIPPEVNISTKGILSCTQPSVILSAENGTDNGPEFEYLWTSIDGTPLGDDITVNADEEGIYGFTVTNIENGCQSTAQIEVEADYNYPHSEFSFQQEGFTLFLFSTSSGNPFNHAWTASNGWSSDDPNSSIPLESNEEIEICLTIENECGTDTHCELFMVDLTGQIVVLKDREEQPSAPELGNDADYAEITVTAPANRVAIFPNPTANKLTVNADEPIIGLEVFNMSGKRISTSRNHLNTNIVTVVMSGLDDGIYYIRITTSKGSTTKAITKATNR